MIRNFFRQVRRADAAADRPTFRAGVGTLLGFGAAFAVVTAIWVPLTAAVADAPAWLDLLTEVGKFAAIAGVVWVLLRVEEVAPSALGLTRRHLASALAAFGALWVLVNLLGVGIAVATGNRWSVELLWYLPEAHPAVQRFDPLPATWLTFLLLNFLVVGLVEEVAFRGYFQSKVIALLGGGSALRVALGIGATSLLFGALHTPAAVVAGRSLDGVLGAALLPTVTAVLFGVFYELTRNVYFVALLHGLGNTWPLVVDWANWSGTALVGFWAGTAVVYLGAALACRYWTGGAALPVAPRSFSDAGNDRL
jgi:membrane protease YdiL (CAAX protease family)